MCKFVPTLVDIVGVTRGMHPIILNLWVKVTINPCIIGVLENWRFELLNLLHVIFGYVRVKLELFHLWHSYQDLGWWEVADCRNRTNEAKDSTFHVSEDGNCMCMLVYNEKKLSLTDWLSLTEFKSQIITQGESVSLWRKKTTPTRSSEERYGMTSSFCQAKPSYSKGWKFSCISLFEIDIWTSVFQQIGS